MTDNFKKNAYSWGPEGVEWFNSIPALVDEYEAKWSLRALLPFDLNYNYVAPAERADGSRAVLKIGFPKDTDFQSEVKALKFFNGEGSCQLLEVDEQRAVILLEKVGPGTPLAELENDDEATRIIASVMKKLHKPLSSDHKFVNITTWSAAILEYGGKYVNSKGPLPAHLVGKAEKLFKYLIETSGEAVLAHGDLHQNNILLSDERGWVAIDPKGIAAEPAYDAAVMIRNPYEKLKNIDDLKPLLETRITILSEELGIDGQRITDWCFAQTMLSAVWSLDAAKGPEHALRVARVLDSMSTSRV